MAPGSLFSTLARVLRGTGPGVAAALAALVGVAAAHQGDEDGAPEGAPRPNVLVLLIDDIGLELLRCYDDENILPRGSAERAPRVYPRTPTIDRLAREGVRFTQARVPPTCSPARATILSGRYPFRHGIGAIIRRADSTEAYLRSSTIEFGVGPGNREWTIGHLARAAGHRSFMAGKWHLALLEKNVALGGEPGAGWDHVRSVGGFDDYWAVWANLPGWPKPPRWTDPEGVLHRPGYHNFVAGENGEVTNVRDEYVTTLQANKVLEFVAARGEEPWLVYCSFNAVHSPYQLPPDDLVATAGYLERARAEAEGAAGSNEDKRSTWPFYAAMVEALDFEMGRIVDGLEELGQLDRTMILLLGDNGTPVRVMQHAVQHEGLELGELITSYTARGRERFKHTVWECGVRVPLIVRGPLVSSPGRRSNALVDGTDVFETVREILDVERGAAGIPDDHAIDGVSFLPQLQSPDAVGARRFSFVEHFEPNGNPETIVFERGGMSHDYMLRRAILVDSDEGRFKLVRNRDSGGDGRDRLFHLARADGTPVDPWEQRPLDVGKGGAHRAQLDQARMELDRLVRSEESNWR